MDPSTWPQSLLAAVSLRGQSPAPPAKPREPQSAKKKRDRVARNAAIAGAIGVGIGGLSGLKEDKSFDKIARRALTIGAASAAGAAAFTDSEGSILTRAAAGLGASWVAGTVAERATKGAERALGHPMHGRDLNYLGYEDIDTDPRSRVRQLTGSYMVTKNGFGAGEVNRPYV